MSASDWKPYNVPGLAGLLAEQPTDSGTHAMAWQQAYETLTDQRQRIEAARAALTQAWPATPGSAAASFFDQVDALTQAMRATAESAVDAHGALTGIVTAVDGATTKVDTLHRSWQQNQATIGDVVPTDDWTQPLNDQARAVMGQADVAIAEHATQLTPPAPYFPMPQTSAFGRQSQATKTGPPTTGPNARVSPTASPFGTPTTAGSQSSGMTGRVLSSTRTKGGSTGGVTNTDIGMPPIAIPSGSTTPRSGPSKASPSQRIATEPPGSAAGDGADLRRGGAVDSSQAVASQRRGSTGAAARARREVPSGGGSPPRAGLVRNPDGTVGRGVIADAPSPATGFDEQTSTFVSDAKMPTSPTPSTTAEVPYGAMIGGGQSMASAGSNGQRRRDQMNSVEWQMPIGVPAVLEPLQEIVTSHDPGPGVIGIDR